MYHDENDQPLWGRDVTNPTLANPFAIDFSGALPIPLDGPAWTGWGGAGNPDGYYYFQNAQIETDSWAVYGQADFFVNDEITIKAGLRYTSDEKTAYEDSIAIIDGQGAYAQFFNDFVTPLVAPAPNAWFLTSAVLAPPTRASYTSGLSAQTHEAEWNSMDWSLGIDYQPNDDHLLYAKVSTGYKAGGFQLGANTDDAATTDVDEAIVEEETLLAYELGHKGTLMDGRFQSNTTAYWYDYDNFQAPLQYINSLGLNGTKLVSADKAKQWGIEWDGQWAVNDAWTLYSTYSFMDTEIVDMGQLVIDVNSICSQDPVANAASLALWAPAGAQAAAGCTPEDVTGNNIDGNEMVKAPKNKFSLNSVYTWYVGDGNELGLTLSYVHTGEQFSSIFNRSATQVPSWERMDARLSYFMPDSDVRIIGYVRNIADEQYMDHISMSVAGMGSWVYGNQLVGGGLAYRTYGIQIDVNF